ncbi:hypothetical protein JHK87_027444 [Glycine soja]|nr:hypothetical protein JHK87_027444 [Glycine soja]
MPEYMMRKCSSSSNLMQDRDVDAADLISFMLELSFHEIGEGRKGSWFIPTKLATNLSMSLADSSSRKQVSYWVEYQFPNLIVGAITKESLYSAFENGITAEHIDGNDLFLAMLLLGIRGLVLN